MSVFRFPIIIHNYIFYISPFIPSAKANGISDNIFKYNTDRVLPKMVGG